jgi:exopolysaccharide biosynthesis polyprenyl glycosylphosphotransferase
MNISHTELSWREQFFRSPLPLMISDIFAVACAYYATLLLRFYWPHGKMVFAWINITLGFRDSAEVGVFLEQFYFLSAPRILLLLTATLVFLYAYSNLYARRSLIRPRSEGWAIAVANLAALGLFYAYFYLTRNEFHPRSVFATLLTLNIFTTLLGRIVMRMALRLSPISTSRVLLIGDGAEADYIDRYIRITRAEGLSVVARLPSIHPLVPEQSRSTIRRAVEAHNTHLILCADTHLSVAEIMQLLELGESLGQEVKILSDKLNVLINEAAMPSDYFMELPLVHFAVCPTGTLKARIRQAFFRILAGLGLVLSIPLMALVALLIKVTSSGPVFFMQERIGINRKPFDMFKFRTMHNCAEELQAQIEEFNDSGEGLFKMREDPRVTAIGRFLRRFSLDELPQLINVVRGEMTLVGPRPLPRRDYQNYYEEWHYSRHSGLPGLTCLWQVSGRSDISFHNMCILDDYYLRNQSAMLDLKILLRTIRVVLFAKGAY